MERERMQTQKRPTPRPKVKRAAPPDQTHAEAFYYVKQMQNRTPMVVVMDDGEELHGVIEWYDRSCLKLNRTDGPNLLVYKDAVKYLYKAEDDESDD
ncbi:MAG: RNA chaperone Hfq [Bryobacterales bacterium]|nr:RNA chaperone Hfq [Acidobacteriota bacterium]MCB9384582.1 RNA chaperone Hfq [Bryobacterales bacterium]